MAAAPEELLERVDRIAPVIEEHAEQAEANRALSDAVYDALLDAGLFGMLVPKAFGGLELHPVQAYRVWEAVSRIDSAAGWNLQIGSSIGGFACWLPEDGAAELYARGPATVFAGGFFPAGPSLRVDGGWRVSARTSFASGCQRAHWFAVPIVEVADDESRFDPRTEDPPKIVAYVPRDEVDLIDSWHTVGMRGTFSADVSVDDVFVPDRRVACLERPRTRGPAFSGPLYGTVPWPGIHGEACVSLGIASAAIDELVDLALRKKPSYGRTPLHHRAMAQHHAAKARALVDASRSFLDAAISQACEEAARGGRLSDAAKQRCQLAACFAASACAEAVDLVHEAAGASAIRLGQRFERFHRDIHVLTQHADKAYGRYEDVGSMMFGLPPSFFTLEI